MGRPKRLPCARVGHRLQLIASCAYTRRHHGREGVGLPCAFLGSMVTEAIADGSRYGAAAFAVKRCA